MPLFSWLRIVLTRLFGTIRWTPPTWTEQLISGPLTRIKQAGEGYRQALQKPKNAAAAVVGLISVIGLALIWHYRPRSPEPIRLSIAIERPTPPPPRKAHDVEPPPTSLKLKFDGSAAPIELINKSIERGVALKPPVAGDWHWQSDSELIFTPRQHWPIGQTFSVHIDEQAVAKHVRLAEADLDFTTERFTATFSQTEFYQDPLDPKIKQVVATLRFNYPVEPNSLESRIALTLIDPQARREQPFRFAVIYDDLKYEATIRSDVVAIPLEDQNMRLTLSSGVVAALGGPKTENDETREVRIPGRYNLFRIQNAAVTLVRNEQYDPEQVLVIGCTSGVHETVLASGVSAYLLPIDKPAIQGKPQQKNYGWYEAAEIGPEVLKQSTEVVLTPIPAEHEISTLHTFKVEVPAERRLFIKIKKGIEAHGGYLLARDFETIVAVPAYPREVRIMHEGALLALGGEQTLSLLTRGLPAIRIEIARVLPRDLNHLLSQSDGDFKNPYFRNYYFNEQNVSELFSEIRKLDNADPRRAQYTTVDFSRYIAGGDAQNRGLFILNVVAWDPDKDQPVTLERKRYQTFHPESGDDEGDESEEVGGEYEETGYDDEESGGYAGNDGGDRFDQASDRRFVLITDLGLLIKTDAEQNQTVFVQSIATGAPVADAVVDVLGKNGIPVLTGRTDSQGIVRFPTLQDFVREKQPVAYLVRRGADLSFLPVGRGDRLLNFSRFDVGGAHTRGQADALAAYLFSDRGIYRPGETFHIGMVVKPVDWTRSVADVPVQLVVTDARGIEVKKERLTLPASGLVEFAYTTQDNAPTGTYAISVFVVQDENRQALLGSTTVRIEEFLPDRLRIISRIVDAPSEGWVSPEDLTATVDLQNLFGTPAVGHRVSASIVLQPRFPTFRGYQDYTFYDPSRAERSYEERLDDGETDENGTATFDLDLTSVAPATYQLRFLSEGYELDGGRGVSTEVATLVSPRSTLVGYQPDGDLSYIKKGARQTIELIAIDSNLQKTKLGELTAQLVEQRWVSVLVRQSNGSYQYESVLKDTVRSQKPLTVAATGTRYPLPTAEPGTFILSIRDQSDTELNRIPFQVVGEGNLTRDLERNAELQVMLDRKDYAPGDTIEVQIKAPYIGAGLITIERDKVYAHRWFKTTTTTSVQTITVPAGLEGNGYLNVAFVRALDSAEIFMSPLSTGVVPFSVDRSRRTVTIELGAKEVVRPGDTLAVSYKTDRPAKVVIFGVDEGILQVANYHAPNPLDYFLSKRALEVGTWQILDLILPEYHLVRKVSRQGGDEELAALANNLNPFKRKHDRPIAFWSGILDAGPMVKTYSYAVPDSFNGSLRLMAVAISPEAMGTAGGKTVVRGPFVLNPNTPLFVGPGDTFEASVSIANNLQGSGDKAKVRVALETTGGLEIVGEAATSIAIPENREGVARFNIRTTDRLGGAELRFRASIGAEQARFTATTSVRPAMPYMTSVTSGSIRDRTIDIPITREIDERLGRLEISVSPLPLSLARGLAVYLENYPHLCTEQLVSSAMPALILSGHSGFGSKQTKQALEQIFTILQARQNAEGAFGFWAANSYVSDFQALHITQFLLEASERGYPVPSEMSARALRYVREIVKRPLTSRSGARLRAYGIYLLGRYGQLATAELAELVQYLRRDPKDEWQADITTTYIAASYQLMRDVAEAQKMIRTTSIRPKVEVDETTFYDTTSHQAQQLYLLAKHFPDRLQQLEGALLEQLTAGIAEQRFNTLSSAQAILALDAYAKAVTGTDRNVLAKTTIVELRGDVQAAVPLGLSAGRFPVIPFSHQAKAIRIRNGSDLPLFYSVTVAGFDRAPPSHALTQGIELIHRYEDEAGNPVRTAALGDTVHVRLKIRAIDRQQLANVAIVDLLPAGFDLVLDPGSRSGIAEGGGDGENRLRTDYVDLREDRIILYGSISDRVSAFVYRIKAVSRGKFRTPPSFAECMYDRSLLGRSLGADLVVTGE